MSPLELRLALKERGFLPIPCVGKKPTLADWQHTFEASPEEMQRWIGTNTGALTGPMPAVDIDITHPEAADAVESAVKDWFSDRGLIPVRFGELPKRAMLFRTSQPFSKMAVCFTAPNGQGHKIEILGDGQQVIVHGVHPDVKQPYTYHGDPLWAVSYGDLPEVTESEMRDLIGYLTGMLKEDFGFEVAAQEANGADPRDPWQHQQCLVLQHTDTNELYRFVTSSKTGRRAVGNLLLHYTRMQKTRPDDLPVVQLGKGGFNHKDPRVGFVATPVFVVVGRAPRDSATKPDTSIGNYLNDEIKL